MNSQFFAFIDLFDFLISFDLRIFSVGISAGLISSWGVTADWRFDFLD